MATKWKLIVDGDEIARALAELKPAALKVWLFVRWKAGHGEVRVKQATIAAAVDMTARNVRRWLDQLVADGWLAIVATGRAAVFSCPRQNCPVSTDSSARSERTEPTPLRERARLSPSENLSSRGREGLATIVGAHRLPAIRELKRVGDIVQVHCSPAFAAVSGRDLHLMRSIAAYCGASEAIPIA